MVDDVVQVGVLVLVLVLVLVHRGSCIVLVGRGS